jgi:hypothetical protein
MRLPLPLLVAVLLAGVLGATPARAQTSMTVGAGLGYLLTRSNTSHRGSLGLALQAVATHPLNDSLSLRLHLGWGFTHFNRTNEAIQFGNSAASWTANAYSDVTDWLVNGDDRYILFKIMGAFFAYTFLTVGFMVAAISYVVSPLLATSFMDLGLTAAAHLGFGPLGILVEGGFGALVYAHPSRGIVPGVGPLVGVVYRHERVRLGLRMLWSPPSLQAGKAGSTHAFAGSATVGIDL